MKGIFVIALALCLGACASQPERTVAADLPAATPTEQTQPSDMASERPSNRAYLDDYDRVPYRMPDRGSEVRVLRGSKG